MDINLPRIYWLKQWERDKHLQKTMLSYICGKKREGSRYNFKSKECFWSTFWMCQRNCTSPLSIDTIVWEVTENNENLSTNMCTVHPEISMGLVKEKPKRRSEKFCNIHQWKESRARIWSKKKSKMFNTVVPLFINKYNTNRAICLRFQRRKRNKNPCLIWCHHYLLINIIQTELCG